MSVGGGVLIGDPDDESRRSVVEALAAAGYEARGFARADALMAAALAAPPDAVLLEVELPPISGYAVCAQLRERFGDRVAIMFVSARRTEPFDRVAGLLAGADDYLAQPFATDELVLRLRSLTRRLRPGPTRPAPRLTPRERQILALLTTGAHQDAIAARLAISRRTVGAHIENILRKLGAHSRAEAVAVAYSTGLVDALAG